MIAEAPGCSSIRTDETALTGVEAATGEVTIYFKTVSRQGQTEWHSTCYIYGFCEEILDVKKLT